MEPDALGFNSIIVRQGPERGRSPERGRCCA